MNRRAFLLKSLGVPLSALGLQGCGGGASKAPVVPASVGAAGGAINPAAPSAPGGSVGVVIDPTIAPVTGNKGIMFLSTRGFARTFADEHNTNKEAVTLHRQECPYGASSGWKVTYLGFTDATPDTILLMGAAVWIQQSPASPRVKLRLKFGGVNTVAIAPQTLVECDPISLPLSPGAVVWSTQWYRSGSESTGLPFQTWLNTRESAPGAEDRDGALAGPLGSLSDRTLTGGFDTTPFLGSLSAGQPYLARGYRPITIVGQPHPDFTGTEIVPCWIGDSIAVMQNDFTDSGDPLDFRGYNGRFCGAKYPNIIFAQSGAASNGFLLAVGTPLFEYVFGGAGARRKCTHLVNEYGLNSVRVRIPPDDIASWQWNDRAVISAFAKTLGLPYIQTTLTPCEHGWATTLDDAQFAVFIQQRQLFNQQVRAQSDSAHMPGCIGFIDPCTVLENDYVRGDNVWVSQYRSDGIHPSSAGHAAFASTIDPSLFTNHPNPIL